jgi:hypothetical protein
MRFYITQELWRGGLSMTEGVNIVLEFVDLFGTFCDESYVFKSGRQSNTDRDKQQKCAFTNQFER